MSIKLRDDAIARVCDALGCSRSALARRLDCAESTVFRLDRGESKPSPRLIAALLTVMQSHGTSFEDLFEIEGDNR